MKLSKPGLYRIVGSEYELLANIIGEAPLFRITGALLLNKVVNENKFEVLPEESIEIQSVYANPDSFLFFEWEYTHVANLPQSRRSIRGEKMPDITENEYKEYCEVYLQNARIPGRGIVATKSYILERTTLTLPQITVLLMHIGNNLRRKGLL